MKVKTFKWANVIEQCGQNVIMLKAFLDFYNQLKYCDWEIPNDILRSFRTADIVTCEGKPFNRVVFNIGGNKYRLICGYKFGNNSVVLYVRFAGTHKKYDKIKVCEVNMF
jgi:mRNA interferase HigB